MFTNRIFIAGPAACYNVLRGEYILRNYYWKNNKIIQTTHVFSEGRSGCRSESEKETTFGEMYAEMGHKNLKAEFAEKQLLFEKLAEDLEEHESS